MVFWFYFFLKYWEEFFFYAAGGPLDTIGQMFDPAAQKEPPAAQTGPTLFEAWRVFGSSPLLRLALLVLAPLNILILGFVGLLLGRCVFLMAINLTTFEYEASTKRNPHVQKRFPNQNLYAWACADATPLAILRNLRAYWSLDYESLDAHSFKFAEYGAASREAMLAQARARGGVQGTTLLEQRGRPKKVNEGGVGSSSAPPAAPSA